MPSFETPGHVSLHVRLPAGRVVVATADVPRTDVEVVPIGRHGREAAESVIVTADERGGRHVVTIEQEDRFRFGPLRITFGDVEVRIRCPQGADLELSGGSTDLRAEGTLGEVEVRTASGDVRLETVASTLEVRTASGDVEVRDVQAKASLGTVSGDLVVRRLAAPANARTVSGDAELGVVSAPLTLSTTSGDVHVRSLEAGEVRVQTVSGDVRIGVARGTPVWIDAASVSGDLSSELGVTPEEPVADDEPDGARAVVPLHVKTVSGDVAIVRSTEPAPV
ncbi:MAG TPA: DUF4097 family beta strand repeat-containing protein [Gaiellaceae bacterium]|nr:DUF4097 family beta strand repeat-containing protein [Gaiellaceae bacterium]